MKEIKFPTINSVENFKYNGFSVLSKPGFAKYRIVKFLNWTNDPGIGKFLCTDKKERLIPTCCLSNKFIKTLPKQELSPNIIGGKGDIIGIPSES